MNISAPGRERQKQICAALASSIQLVWQEIVHQNNLSQELPYRNSHPHPYLFVQRLRSDTYRVAVILIVSIHRLFSQISGRLFS
jgi:hypothetical protein